MDTQVKEKWVEALRGGEYTQGHGQLKNDNHQFCCLGVLCDVSGAGKWKQNSYGVGGEYGLMGLPEAFELSVDLSPEQTATLWRMNDGCYGYRKHSFSEIADYIEKNL